MADYNSSLPVRTQTAGDVIVKVADATTPSQQLAVDSTGRIITKIETTSGGTLTSTGTALDVNIASGSFSTGVADKTAFTYGTTLELPVGGVFQDTSPALSAGTTGALRLTSFRGMHINIRDNSGNELGIAAAPLRTDPTGTTTQPVSGTVTANAGTGNFSTNLTQISGATPSATNPLFVELTNGTAAISPTNPLPVYLQDGGTSVNSYNTAAAVASGSTSNADYTVTSGKTLHLEQVWGAAEGKLKIEVQIETGVATGVFTSIYVGFNSAATPCINVPLSSYPEVAAGVRVRVIRTNNEVAAQDVYTTVSGHEQ